MKKREVQNRLTDILMIKRAIESSESSTTKKLFGATLEANLIVQAVGLIICMQFIIYELYFTNAFDTLAKLNINVDFGIQNIAALGYILALLIGCLYFVVWRAARHSNRPFKEYTLKNFSYLSNMSLISDLAVKLTAISLITLSGKLIWISPLLIIFIGDYLIQGRFFTLKLTPSIVLGACCFLVAMSMFLLKVSTILIPLTIFLLITLSSITRLTLLKRSEEKENI